MRAKTTLTENQERVTHEIFRMLDLDGSGQLTAREVREAGIFQTQGADGDPVEGMEDQTFRMMDTDGNRRVDQRELAAFIKLVESQHRGGMGGYGGYADYGAYEDVAPVQADNVVGDDEIDYSLDDDDGPILD